MHILARIHGYNLVLLWLAFSENATDEYEVIQAAESVGKEASSVDWHHFHLHHKDRVYVNLRTINRALNHIDTASDGFLVDLTPPMMAALGDGLEVGVDADYQVRPFIFRLCSSFSSSFFSSCFSSIFSSFSYERRRRRRGRPLLTVCRIVYLPAVSHRQSCSTLGLL